MDIRIIEGTDTFLDYTPHIITLVSILATIIIVLIQHILKGSRNNLLFLRLLDHVQPKNEREQIFVGKKISISLNYELYHFRNMLKIVQMICDCGGEYVKKASIADIFVSYEDVENGRTCTKQKFVEEAIANGAQIQMMSFEEFLKQLNLTEEELNALPDEDVDYLLDEKYKK